MVGLVPFREPADGDFPEVVVPDPGGQPPGFQLPPAAGLHGDPGTSDGVGEGLGGEELGDGRALAV